MKRKIKKLSVMAAALCAVAASASLLGACGEEAMDYSGFTYDDYAAISYAQWDKKTISYQFTSPIDAQNRIEAGFDLYTQILINLYSDGGAAVFQAGLYFTDPGMSDAAWYDEDNHISWASFGQWEASEDGSSIKLYLLCRISPEGTEIEKSDSYADPENFKYCITLSANANGGYSYNGEDDSIKLFGLNLMGEGMSVNISMDSTSGSAAEYKTIESWIETYMDEESSFETK